MEEEDYVDLAEETIRERLLKLNIDVPSNPTAALDELMTLEHTRN